MIQKPIGRYFTRTPQRIALCVHVKITQSDFVSWSIVAIVAHNITEFQQWELSASY